VTTETASKFLNKKVAITMATFGVLLFGLFFANTAHALTLTPIRLEITGDPGETLTKQVTLINEKTLSETFYSSFANFEAQGESGTPTFVTPKDDLGTWMHAPESVVVPASSQMTVSFTITIPKDATPGGHFSAIFWGTTPNKNEPGKVTIGAKVGVLVLLSVSGDVKESAGLIGFATVGKKFFYNTLPVPFEYRFTNDGGDRIKPAGIVTIRDTIFLPADRLNANPVEGNILPGSTRKFQFDWLKRAEDANYVPGGAVKNFFHKANYQFHNFAVGLYSANMKLSYGKEGMIKKTVWFFVFPWQLLIVLIVIFTIVYWGGKKLLRRYNNYIIHRARTGIKTPHDAHHA
jgi:hypothetical protein